MQAGEGKQTHPAFMPANSATTPSGPSPLLLCRPVSLIAPGEGYMALRETAIGSGGCLKALRLVLRRRHFALQRTSLQLQRSAKTARGARKATWGTYCRRSPSDAAAKGDHARIQLPPNDPPKRGPSVGRVGAAGSGAGGGAGGGVAGGGAGAARAMEDRREDVHQEEEEVRRARRGNLYVPAVLLRGRR